MVTRVGYTPQSDAGFSGDGLGISCPVHTPSQLLKEPLTMQTLPRQFSAAPSSPPRRNADLTAIQRVVSEQLAPQVKVIDQEGHYPAGVMRALGEAGAFGQAISQDYDGSGVGLRAAVQAIEAVSKVCLSTGFMTWCQVACTGYLHHTNNDRLRRQLLPDIATGRQLAGTGLSNPMKHFADIERIALHAERVEGGYRINGLLPWVSNLGPGHEFGIAAKLADSDDYLMALVSDGLSGMSLRCNAHFIALEGTGTFSCVFRDVFVPNERVLAVPCDAYVNQIRPGFMLTQVGMGLGLSASCIELMERSNKHLGHVNRFLDDSVGALATDLSLARDRAYTLADNLDDCAGKVDRPLMQSIVQARITAAELSLRAAQGAMLHAGARAYIHGSDPERKLREAYFIAIVTPALKHLKKMLHALETA